MHNEAKAFLLKRREHTLNRAVKSIELSIESFVDHEMYAAEFSDFATRLEACLRDLKKIRSAIGDKADELGGT